MNLNQHLPNTLSFGSAGDDLAHKKNIFVLHGHGARQSEGLAGRHEQSLVLEAAEAARASALFFGRRAGEPFNGAVSLIGVQCGHGGSGGNNASDELIGIQTSAMSRIFLRLSPVFSDPLPFCVVPPFTEKEGGRTEKAYYDRYSILVPWNMIPDPEIVFPTQRDLRWARHFEGGAEAKFARWPRQSA
jgi:hypothetical protein